ncbi:MAG: hypothetical protein PHR68_04155 [Candidatus Gracilibacteria bacterium]|nr:hypothetical protein [Candidatus Gracilibacteria bacterium]
MSYINDISDFLKLIKSNFSKLEGNNPVIYFFLFLISLYINNSYFVQNLDIKYFENLFIIFFISIGIYILFSFFIHVIRLIKYKGKGVIYIDSDNFSIENNIRNSLKNNFGNIKIDFVRYGNLFYISNLEDMEYYYSKYNLEFIIYIDQNKNIFYKYRNSGFYFKIFLERDNKKIENKILILLILRYIENKIKISDKIKTDIYNIFEKIVKLDIKNSLHYVMLRNYCISKLEENELSLRDIKNGKDLGNNNLIFPEYDLIIKKVLELSTKKDFSFLGLDNYFLVIYRGYLYNLLSISNIENINKDDIYTNLFDILDLLFSNEIISEENKYYIVFHYYLYGVFEKYSLNKSKFKDFLINKGLSESIIEKYFKEVVVSTKYTVERVYVYSYFFNKKEFLEYIKEITIKIYGSKLNKDFQFYLDL